VIIEVVGSHPNFQFNTTQAKPEWSRRHVENILVGSVTDREMEQFFNITDEINIDNHTVHWNGQDYVLKAP
jgi:hypothetical protein